MVEACRDVDVMFMIHENFRFQPAIRELQRAVAEADIGAIFWGRVSFRSGLDV
jgi:predicted dehydrogenase